MKKKLTAVALVVCMLAIMLVGASLAYFTDESEVAKNTFTVGNVSIEQLELQRNESEKKYEETDLYLFEQKQTMVPAVGLVGDGKEVCADEEINGIYTHFIDTEKTKNVMDKIIQVKNTSTVEGEEGKIYAATLIAVEDTEDVSVNYRFQVGDTAQDWTFLKDSQGRNIQIKDDNGTVYTLNLIIYQDEIAKDGYSPCALTQVMMKPEATQESVKIAGDTYDILALSLGIQATGFESANEAIQAGFGSFAAADMTAERVAEIADMFGDEYTGGYYVGKDAGWFTSAE